MSESIVRSTALSVFLLLMCALAFQAHYLLFFLSADFLLRAAGKSAWSPLAWVSKNVLAHILPFSNRKIYEPPKRFAASIGFFFSLTAAVLFSLEFVTAAYVVTAVLALFSFLEFAFSFCAGCMIHSFLQKLKH